MTGSNDNNNKDFVTICVPKQTSSAASIMSVIPNRDFDTLTPI